MRWVGEQMYEMNRLTSQVGEHYPLLNMNCLQSTGMCNVNCTLLTVQYYIKYFTVQPNRPFHFYIFKIRNDQAFHKA